MITIQIGKPTNIALPYLYKYMDDEFIELFFEKGILRLGSFNKFKAYPDEIRGDKNEGSGAYNTLTREGAQFLLMTELGQSEYMFSTSLISDESIKKQFNVSGSFKIKNPLEFSVVITNAIVGSTQSFLGFCNYQEIRIIQNRINDFSAKEFMMSDDSLIIGGPKMNQRSNEIIGNGIDLLFLKENKYQTQAEFRFVWSINTKFHTMKEHLDVECGEAIEFCERI